MAKQKQLPMSARIALVAVLLGGSLFIGALWMRYNDMLAERETLAKQVELLRAENERLAEEIAAPWNEEYVKRAARREPGHCLPGEVIYFSNFDE